MRSLLLLFSILSLHFPAASSNELLEKNDYGAPPGKSEKRLLLRGIIQHQNTMPPMPTELSAGNIFDSRKLKTLTPNNAWFKIPRWFAGSWNSEFTTNFRTDFLKHNYSDRSVKTFPVSSNDEVDGLQQDRYGEIWDKISEGQVSISLINGLLEVSAIKAFEPVDISEEQVTMRVLSYDIRVDQYNNRILSAHQAERIQRYTPTRTSARKVYFSVKTFDQKGLPERLVQGFTIDLKKAPFKQIDTFKGQNLRSLFNEYLESHGMAERIVRSKNR